MRYFASLMDRPKTGQFGVNLTKTPEWFEVAIRLRTNRRRLVQWSNAVGLRPLPICWDYRCSGLLAAPFLICVGIPIARSPA